jgi:hypothetical protein
MITLAWVGGCAQHELPSLSKERARGTRLEAGEAAPVRSEVEAAGAITGPVRRDERAFRRLVRSDHPLIVYKNEEGTGADHLMTPRLKQNLHRLAERIQREWPGVRLRVTEAWDESAEHGRQSLHYEGRAADLTTSDRDARKLGRVAGLALESGFDWVYFENASHVHVSVRK